MRAGIGFKLAVLLATFGVLATGLSAYTSYQASRQMLVKAAERDLQQAGQVVGASFVEAISDVAQNVRILATLPAARRALRPDVDVDRQCDDLADLFQRMLAVHPAYFQIRLIGAADSGRELLRLDRDGVVQLRVRGEDRQEKGHFPYVFRTLALSPGKLYLSPIFLNHEGRGYSEDKPTLQVASPVFDEQGVARGLIVINVDLNGIFDALKADLPASVALYLTNEAGEFLIHPDASRTFSFERGQRVVAQDGIPAVGRLLAGHVGNVVTTLEASPDAPAGRGEEVAAFTRLSLDGLMPGRFVMLGLAEPVDVVLRDTRALEETNIKVVLGFSLAAILLALVVSRLVTRPLQTLGAEVARFAREHRMGSLPTRRRDEIGQLARDVDAMQREITAHLAELDASRRQLDHLVRHDPLTNLPNRRLVHERLEHAIAAARRSGKYLALMFLDLDRFKEINDKLGHAVGDAVLIETARRLTSRLREVDTVARIGGDEFVILVDGLDQAVDGEVVAGKVAEAFQAPMEVAGHRIQVSTSIGVSRFPEDGQSADELLHRADTAMYISKAAGRDGHHLDTLPPPGDSPT